jgi:tryptophan synthase alpha chain
MVACYPDRESSMEYARALIDGGSCYLEIQFPFSDPTADGKYIQAACNRALQQGFTVAQGFDLVSNIRTFTDTPIFIMCYGNTVFFHGVEKFLGRCKRAAVQGLIVPDLPPEYDEGLYPIGEELGLSIVPVVAPTVKEDRLRRILNLNLQYIYAALRTGTTGQQTVIGEENLGFLESIRLISRSRDIRILAGFGISSREQIETLSPYVHAPIIGSAFIREVMNNREKNIYGVILAKMKRLLGA